MHGETVKFTRPEIIHGLLLIQWSEKNKLSVLKNCAVLAVSWNTTISEPLVYVTKLEFTASGDWLYMYSFSLFSFVIILFFSSYFSLLFFSPLLHLQHFLFPLTTSLEVHSTSKSSSYESSYTHAVNSNSSSVVHETSRSTLLFFLVWILYILIRQRNVISNV